jgi:hypothetical protein
MPNHDCLANTCHEFASAQDGFVMTVKALRTIKEGEDISHSYTEPLDTLLARQTVLTMGKFFLVFLIILNSKSAKKNLKKIFKKSKKFEKKS